MRSNASLSNTEDEQEGCALGMPIFMGLIGRFSVDETGGRFRMNPWAV